MNVGPQYSKRNTFEYFDSSSKTLTIKAPEDRTVEYEGEKVKYDQLCLYYDDIKIEEDYKLNIEGFECNYTPSVVIYAKNSFENHGQIELSKHVGIIFEGGCEAVNCGLILMSESANIRLFKEMQRLATFKCYGAIEGSESGTIYMLYGTFDMSYISDLSKMKCHIFGYSPTIIKLPIVKPEGESQLTYLAVETGEVQVNSRGLTINGKDITVADHIPYDYKSVFKDYTSDIDVKKIDVEQFEISEIAENPNLNISGVTLDVGSEWLDPTIKKPLEIKFNVKGDNKKMTVPAEQSLSINGSKIGVPVINHGKLVFK